MAYGFDILSLAEGVHPKAHRDNHQGVGGNFQGFEAHGPTHQPGGDGRADIGSENNGNRLRERQQPGINQAYDDDGGRGAGLDQCRDARAGGHA